MHYDVGSAPRRVAGLCQRVSAKRMVCLPACADDASSLKVCSKIARLSWRPASRDTLLAQIRAQNGLSVRLGLIIFADFHRVSQDSLNLVHSRPADEIDSWDARSDLRASGSQFVLHEQIRRARTTWSQPRPNSGRNSGFKPTRVDLMDFSPGTPRLASAPLVSPREADTHQQGRSAAWAASSTARKCSKLCELPRPPDSAPICLFVLLMKCAH